MRMTWGRGGGRSGCFPSCSFESPKNSLPRVSKIRRDELEKLIELVGDNSFHHNQASKDRASPLMFPPQLLNPNHVSVLICRTPCSKGLLEYTATLFNFFIMLFPHKRGHAYV